MIGHWLLIDGPLVIDLIIDWSLVGRWLVVGWSLVGRWLVVGWSLMVHWLVIDG
ncbi:MAG: hypothetical protein ACPGWR_16665 [Ardenticatenaceae bacterium]